MFDVIIVGAGPAGGMAAKTIANSGYSVAIIEIKKEVGYPVQCAESVSEFCLNTIGIEKDDRWIKNAVRG
ncbi:MAG: NAD(P)/FAD-dependent oxidoreductase, partial [Thermoplasmata archaeon]|nr:NAD(P)/FAD-dependent oxidoreductase [Thermoplasmata archaeon]